MNEQLIPLTQIHDNRFQDREVYKDIEELGRAIASQGLQQTPKARKNNKGYELKFGHRRKRAFDWLRVNYKKEGLPERYEHYTLMPLEIEELSDEQMFDHMVVENVHRDDLKVTEKARLLRRYKEMHPQATSEQIGLVFNMNPATVRGMDIFLDLPEPVQAKLDDGTITMGTARLFHSMQKIAPPEKVIQTLKQVEKESGNSLPEEVIEERIEHLENVVDLWNEHHRDGKPRAGYHGWLLDMKNFPVQLLPALDEKAKAGLADEQVEHLQNPPACNACPFYTKIRGSHYCGVKACYQRKSTAWDTYMVEQTSKQTGIAIYAKTDGGYCVLSNWQDQKLFDSKHADLRLAPTTMIGSNHYQSFKGVDDDIVLVVATGKALDKMKTVNGKKISTGKKTEKEKAEMRAMKLYRTRRREFLWEYTALAHSMFEAVPSAILKKLNDWRFIGIDDRIPDDYQPARGAKEADVQAYLRRALLWRLIVEKTSHYRRDSLTEKLTEFQALTGVRTPKAFLTRVETWEAEINAIARVVSTATKKSKPA